MKKLVTALVTAVERFRIWLLAQPWFTSVLLPALPRRLRWALRRVYLAPVDLADRWLGRREESLPPKASTFTGAVSDFAATGGLLLEALRETAGLTPSSQLLDVGCGLGRLAIPVAGFLDPEGGYEGIDIVPDGIAWCRANVSGPYGNVHFTLADVHNKEYHPKGRMKASEYTFPFADDSFDVAVLISVFTHMLPAEVNRYLSELARVLKPGGRAFISYFLLSPETEALMATSSVQRRFRHRIGEAYVASVKVPELSVGYRESYIRELCAAHGFAADPVVLYGAWSGRRGHWPADSGLGDQDTVIATVR
ncbi:class I SAM-dependent methyltransferase [Streptacidiphilus albus]|uniref:class I SAM-dependent methyltransferase n=1 Tax=Streptacidiphilus albus TaxID=105425 RepID=UPI00068CE4BB|nr:methyltransferase domain-containing protein [Streptacidiphilus albus]